MKQIRIIMNSGGMITDVFASMELADVDVEVIDFCTDDPKEQNDAEERWQATREKWRKGELTSIY